MKAFLLFFLCFLVVQEARSDVSLMLGGWSTHLSDYEYNETHDLVALEYRNVIAARFNNSFGRESYALGYNFKYSDPIGPIQVGVYAGAVRGYRGCFDDEGSTTNICPLVAPYLAFDALASPAFMIMGDALVGTIRINF